MQKLSALIVALVFAALWWVVVLIIVIGVGAAVGAHTMGYVVGPRPVVTRFHPLTFPATWFLFSLTMLGALVNARRRKRIEDWAEMTRKESEFEADYRSGDTAGSMLYLATYLPSLAAETFLTLFQSDEE